MALEEEPAESRQELHRAIDCLAGSADLKDVPLAALWALADGAVHFSLPAGYVLFESGSTPDGVYLLANGRLAVRLPGYAEFTAEVERGELVGEAGWLLSEPHSATVSALRDSEILMLPHAVLEAVAVKFSQLPLAIARLSARRLRRSNSGAGRPSRARVFALVPNSDEVDAIEFAARWVEELARAGRAELVWDVRAGMHTSEWFSRLEESNDYVVYVADSADTGWTRLCCRQADVILALAHADSEARGWPQSIADAAARGGTRIELALRHPSRLIGGAAGRWLPTLAAALHHHIVDASDLARLTRLMTRRGLGLVLSGGGARGFAHLGVIRALREARVPLDFVAGVSIGAIISAGVAMGWSDAEMMVRYRRSFVDTNPVNDYAFPLVALTRGRKVSRLLEREYGETRIEDLPVPYFCVSASLTTGRALEHRQGVLSRALRASVAIPGVMPPVFEGDEVLVDGAAINNLPVDLMRRHAPGYVLGCDAGADRSFCVDLARGESPPLWRFFARGRGGRRRINIFQVLMHAGMVNSVATALAQRSFADSILKPPLSSIDLLSWRSFDRAIEAGYRYARQALDELPDVPRLAAAPLEDAARPESSLNAELDRRLALRAARAG
jgi:NTE family protein